VISGKKSVTGKPILANDPHLGHGAPGIWYEAHLVTPNMNVSGAFLPGTPYVVIGANEHVAWGFTNVMADDTDFYIEKINPADPDQYEYQGRWEKMEIREEIINVKGSDDVTLKTRLTRHGPVIDKVNDYKEPAGTAITMHWAAYENYKVLQALQILNTAESIDDIERAAEYFKCPGQNWVYADDRGNIGYWAAVGIPRREGFTGALPVEGWNGQYEWKGYVPTGEQPHLRNPDRGWIATANNRHVGDDYPYPISHYYAMPDRYVRIKEMLLEKEKLSVDDFERMHNDFYMVMAAEWVPVMLEALSGADLSQIEKEALAALEKWDYVASVDGVAPTIFHTIINTMVQETYQKRMGEELYSQYIKNNYVVFNSLRNLVAKKESLWFDDPDTVEKETLNQLITASYREAVASLEKQLGPEIDTWIWGELHTLTIQHPFGRASALMGYFFNIGPFPMGGSVATVNPQPYRLSDPWDGYHGASLRYIVDFADRTNSRRVIPAGISGNFMSPHYKDQVDLWRTCDYRPFVLDRESIEKDRKYTMNMRPE
jgi:penicillin amidase